MSDPTLDTWPDALRRIAEVIGPELALRLAEHDGGLDKVYVPRSPKPSHPWAELLGADALGKLARAFGGERIDIPRGTHIALRKRRIIELATSGMSRRQIARAVGVGERYVRKVLAGGETTIATRSRCEDPRQLKMF
jgi:hypothetical protein